MSVGRLTFSPYCFLPCREDLVLIEDLRAGGTFAAQSKSDFSTRKCKNLPSTPEIVIGSDIENDTFPNVDFRTNVVLNLEGI